MCSGALRFRLRTTAVTVTAATTIAPSANCDVTGAVVPGACPGAQRADVHTRAGADGAGATTALAASASGGAAEDNDDAAHKTAAANATRTNPRRMRVTGMHHSDESEHTAGHPVPQPRRAHRFGVTVMRSMTRLDAQSLSPVAVPQRSVEPADRPYGDRRIRQMTTANPSMASNITARSSAASPAPAFWGTPSDSGWDLRRRFRQILFRPVSGNVLGVVLLNPALRRGTRARTSAADRFTLTLKAP
jgi:hypothetical protein